MQKIIGLQYLRALAAVSVTVAHATGRFGEPWVLGVAGVDLFFVISGFMMVLITDDRSRPTQFFVDRLTRIAPLYWIVTTVMLIGAILGLFPRMVLSADYVLKSYLFIPVKAPVGLEALPLVPHGWTLNYEMLFYVVFTLLLLAPERSRAPLLALIATITVACGRLFAPRDLLWHTWLHPVILEFVAGALLGHTWKRRPIRSVHLGALLVVTAFLLLAVLPASESAGRVICFGIPALLMLAGTLMMEDIIRSRARVGWAVYVGDASYSIYLWHGLLVSISVGVAHFLDLSPLAGFAVAVMGSVAFGSLAHAWLEIPLTRLARHGHHKKVKKRQPLIH